MKAVILVLLLVAATLVHSVPIDNGKSLYENSKHQTVHFTFSVTKVGAQFFIWDRFPDVRTLQL
jgi:Fe2+ or Zn2+ uptake regulation protein